MSRQNILSAIIGIIPISYILGSFILNLNVLIIIIIGLFLYIEGKRFKINIFDKLILIFFSYVLLTGIINTIELTLNENIELNDYTIIIKSFLFLRYLLLYLSIRILIYNDLLNFKNIFFFFSLASIFVSLDVIFQFFNGKNLFGLTSPYLRKTTGVFYDEAIAGGFIQRFSLFAFFLLATITSIKKNNIKIFILSLIFLVTLMSIIFSGNRMPLVLFVTSIILIVIYNETLKKYFLRIIASMILICLVIINYNPLLKDYYRNFYQETKKIGSLYSFKVFGIGSDLNENRKPSYVHEFESGIGTFKLNKYLGGGIKSFRYNCPKRKIVSINERTTCNMHPHNYYLEILVDLGIFGILIFLIIACMILKKTYKILKHPLYKYTISPFFYVFFMEVFPLKTSGSFFTTNNSVVIFLSLSVIVAIYSKIESYGGPTGNRTPIR